MPDSILAERMHNALIVVVDDMELNRKMLTHSLNAHGYRHILLARDGAEALQVTREKKPDLVILDLMMPAMDGFAFCQEIRRDPAFDNMPIIVQTALDDMDKKLQAFKLGASDYICKPVDPGELNARVGVHLGRRLLVQDLNGYQSRISAEIEQARLMQRRLMPSAQHVSMCERVFDMKIACHFETSSALGGDCWGMRPLSESRLALYMYDCSGHGMTAAMNVFRMHTLMQEIIQSGGDPGNFLSTLNRHLHPLLERSEFATMFYGILDTEANCLLYASAAAPSALLFSAAEKEIVSLSGRGFPLGTVPQALYETKYTPFSRGDLLLLYSDGISDHKNTADEFLSEESIKLAMLAALDEKPHNPSLATVEGLMHLFRSHNGDAPPRDDITVNAYWRTVPHGRRSTDR